MKPTKTIIPPKAYKSVNVVKRSNSMDGQKKPTKAINEPGTGTVKIIEGIIKRINPMNRVENAFLSELSEPSKLKLRSGGTFGKGGTF
ncbi:MAG: hypothetical protein RXN92_04090 [Thermoplasmatales archaeon]